MKHIFSNSPIIHVERTASTNCYLLELSETKKLPEGAIAVTDNQTHGRGVAGNRWESEPGTNLTFSIILYPTSVKASEQFILSKAISLAVYDFLSAFLPAGVYVKWPNDVYVENKKITGILIENFLWGDNLTKSIAGIGVNINQSNFISPAPNPISLRQLTSKTYSLNDCLHSLHACIADRYSMITSDTDRLNSEYIRHLYCFGKLCRYFAGGVFFDATITGVNRYGMLEMTDSKGEQKVFGFKEVKFVP